MCNQYDKLLIRKATKKDIDDCMKIIKEKSKWLKDKGINQWTSFFNRDSSYFMEKVQKEILYVVIIENNICATFVLQENDKYWEDDKKAFYIHHLAVKSGYKGLGRYIIEQIKLIAKNAKKEYIRLDNVADNKKLNEYYDSLGFVIKKQINDDMYNCVLREVSVIEEKSQN